MSTLLLACCASVLASTVASAQTPITPSSPASEGPPVWSRTVKMPDGRTFVTDGGLAIDASVAKPGTLPETVVGGAVLARFLAQPYVEEVGFGDLGVGPFKNTFATPKGVVLNGNYVKYLRNTLPRTVRLRVKGGMDPVVVLLDGRPVAILMPVRH